MGRPKKDNDQDRIQAKRDASERNAIEGKFGEGKRSYGLGHIRARLCETSETVIALQLLVMNLERKLRFFYYFSACYFIGSDGFDWLDPECSASPK